STRSRSAAFPSPGLLLLRAAVVQAAAVRPSLTGRLPDHPPVLRPPPFAAPRPGDPPAGETLGCVSAQGAGAAPGSPRPAHGPAPVDVSSGPPGRPGTRPRRSGGSRRPPSFGGRPRYGGAPLASAPGFGHPGRRTARPSAGRPDRR